MKHLESLDTDPSGFAREHLPSPLADKAEQATELIDAIDRGSFGSEPTEAEKLKAEILQIDGVASRELHAQVQHEKDVFDMSEVRKSLEQEPEANTEIGPKHDDDGHSDSVHETVYRPGSDMSRREFMQNTAFAGVGAFFRKLGFGGKERGKDQAIEGSEHDPRLFNEGIMDLHAKAMKDSVETEVMYVKDKDGTERWIEVTKHTNETSAMSDGKIILDAANLKPETLSLNHTHPLNIVKEVAKDTPMSDIDPTLMRNQPSTLDLIHAQGISELVRQRSPKTKVEFGAVDSGGVWNFQIEDEGFLKDLTDAQQKIIKAGIDIAKKEPKFKEKLMKDFGTDFIDPRVTGPAIMQMLADPENVEKGIISEKSAEKLNKLLAWQSKYAEAGAAFEKLAELEKHGMNMEKVKELSGMGPLQKKKAFLKLQDEYLKEYIELARKVGAKITFTPISKFKPVQKEK